MNKKKLGSVVRMVLLTAVNVLVVAFIFYNSSRVGAASGALSGRVLQMANGALEQLGFGLRLTEYAIRKMGHVAEFALLGFWLTLSLRVYTKRLFAFVAWPLLGGLLVAVADEFIQSFVPGRMSAVTDILYDFGGVILGLVAALVLEVIVRAIGRAFKRRRAKQAEPEQGNLQAPG